MFGDNIKRLDPHKHNVALLVNDEPGVFARISNLFMKRNFNIDTITVGASNMKGMSRITLSFIGDDIQYEQLVKQLNKLIDVVKTTDLPESRAVIRELALIKVNTKSEKEQTQIMNFSNAFRANVVNVGPKEMIVQITGKTTKVDSFIELVKPMGIVEVARTGVTAMARSNNNFEKV